MIADKNAEVGHLLIISGRDQEVVLDALCECIGCTQSYVVCGLTVNTGCCVIARGAYWFLKLAENLNVVISVFIVNWFNQKIFNCILRLFKANLEQLCNASYNLLGFCQIDFQWILMFEDQKLHSTI